MEITVNLGGPLRKKIEGHIHGILKVEMPEGARITEVLTKLGLGPDDIRVIMKNGRPIQSDETLLNGDRLGLFPRQLAFNTMTAISFFNPLARKDPDE